jgi:hypothetical protein
MVNYDTPPADNPRMKLHLYSRERKRLYVRTWHNVSTTAV